MFIGAVAQLGERLVRNEEAGGSTPLSSTVHDSSSYRKTKHEGRKGEIFVPRPNKAIMPHPSEDN